MKLAYIEWWDHCSFMEYKWRSLDEISDLAPTLVKSVGWILKETKEYITIVSTLDEGESIACAEMCILKGQIKKKKVLDKSL